MVKAFINNDEVSIDFLHYDEWVYRKYNPDIALCKFRLIIDYTDFEKRLKERYNAFLQEMIDDDLQTNENFMLDVYKQADYPLFDDVITDSASSYKLDFLNSFFIKDILSEYTSKEKSSKEKDEWIVREVHAVNNDKKNVFIEGNAQPVIHI